MTPDTFDKVLSGVRIFFIVVAVISFLTGRWLDLIIAVLMAIYGGIFISVFFGSYVKRPSDKELDKTDTEKSIDNIRNIRNSPKGTVHDVIIVGEGSSADEKNTIADQNRTINFSDLISEQDLEEAINFLIGLCRNEFTYERLRKMTRTRKRDSIKFSCQAHLVFAARGIARRLSYWKAPETKSLANKNIYPWSYQGSSPIFSNPEAFEHNEEMFENF